MTFAKAAEKAKKNIKVVKKKAEKAAEPAKAAVPEKKKIVKVVPAKPKTKNEAFTASLKDPPAMPMTTINGTRAIGFPMKVLEKHFLTLNRQKIEHDAQFADVLIRMDANGNWSELGAANAHDYFVVRHKISRATIDTHKKAVQLLASVKSEMPLQKAYEAYAPSMLALLFSWAVGVSLTPAEIKAELVHCERDSKKDLDSFRNYLKQKFAARKAKADKAAEEGLPESEIPVKIESFKVPAKYAETIREAVNVAIKQTGNAQTTLGDAISMACADYVGNFGVNYTSLKRTLNAVAHRFNVLPIVLPNPDITDLQNKDLKDVPVLQAFEHNGMFILHTTRAKAAKALGVKTDEVNVIRLNLTAAMRDLYGWEEQMAKTEMPKSIDEMSDDDVVEAIGEVKHALKITREDWSEMAVGKSARDQLLMLLKMKSAKESGAKEATVESPAAEEEAGDAGEPEEVQAMMATDDALQEQAEAAEEAEKAEVVKTVDVVVKPSVVAPKKRVVIKKKKKA